MLVCDELLDRLMRMTIRCLTAALILSAASASGQSKDASRLEGREFIVHLLSRLTYGVTAEDVAAIEKAGVEAWLDRQFSSTRVDSETAKKLAHLATLDLTAKEVYDGFVNAKAKQRERRNQAQYEVLAALLVRATHNELQAGEVMADFWRNHLNVDRNKDSCRYLLTEYDREVVRRHTFGSFHDMLLASAKHPAMLIYLDNHVSRRPPNKTELKAAARKVRRETGSRERGEEAAQIAAQRGLNENYARELLELHTVGVDNGYEQRDVIDVAEALTGWTVDRTNWKFRYRDDMHEHGAKFVMGHTIPRQKRRDGHVEGERIIEMLAKHRNTSEFLAWKLCTYLVADEPPKKFVAQTAKALRRYKFDLGATTRFIVESEVFRDRRYYRSKFKTPLEFVVSALRVTDAEITDVRKLLGVLKDMGQPLYECEDPTGYRDVAESWRDPGVMALRWKFAMELSTDRIDGVRVPSAFWDDLEGERPQRIIARLGRRILPGGMRSDTIGVLMRVARRHEERVLEWDALTAKERKKKRAPRPLERRLLGVLLGAPEFQEQ